ncbi:MAG: T9SS type A sorting domain-containing protein [Cytophagales bacterium]|nr:T9SS type A sorting domain-containing protein [Cytophagales bacterium]
MPISGGYAYYNNLGTAITSSDYNDLFTSGNFVGNWNGVAKNDLAAFQAANSMDVNSISVNPVFVSSTDLHTTSSFVDSTGTPLGIITVDIDGDPRDSLFPDIGADEFVVDSTMTPLIGVYTIGGTSPDYATFTLAVSDLNLRGIAGVVTFNARPGTYIEQVVVLPISGSNSADTVVFQSETGDSSSVIMTYNASTVSDNYVFRLYGASHVSIKNMTLAATGGSYAKVIHINGNVEDVNLLNNLLSSSNTANSVSSVIDTYNDVISDIVIRNNFISEGYVGVNINGDDGIFATRVVIENNIITSSSNTGIYLEDCDAPKVNGNDVSNTGTTYYGIYLEDCDNALQIIKNRVVSSDYYYGIYLRNCNGSAPFRGLIANNFSYVGGTSSAYGIELFNSSYMNVYHNSVNITSTNTGSGIAFYVSGGGSNINVKNNIFSNIGGGYAYYVASASTGAFTSSDNNDLYATGNNLAYWAGIQETLDSLKGASGMDINSLSVNPLFYTNTDLHIAQVLLMGVAMPIALVTDDIDGHPRDPSTPDIGADEFFCEPPAFNVSASDPCLGDSTVFTNLTTGVEPGSTFSWDFDNDGFVDYSSGNPNETIKYLYAAPDTHTVQLIVSQIAGCIDTFIFSAIVHTFPLLNITSQGAYCDSANGEATVSAVSGTPPYTYYWSTGSTATTITGLNLGLYTITVNDAKNCAVIDTVNISEQMSVTVTEISGSTCGNADGIAAVTNVSGGVPPYDFAWSNGDTTDIDSTLTSGVQYVTVIDSNGCAAIGTVTISDVGNAPSVGLISLTNNNCAGEETGSININVICITPPCTYLWSNGSTTEDIDSLSGGIYEVTVTDAAGCVAAKSYTIFTPDPLTTTVVISDASCAASDGSAVVIVNGGTMPYTYSWSTGGINQIETGLSAGIYSVTVTDANLCSMIAPVIVNNVGGPTISIVSTTDVNCNNPSIGAIDINVTGGVAPYTYSWSPTGDTTQNISNLTIGTYGITVTDANGCIAVASIDINETVPAIQPICIVTVDSATGKNLIVWEKTPGLNIASYNIYKEGTQSGNYSIIGTVQYDSLSVFPDPLADPQLRSWRYKMSAVDSCGQESELSPIHKTIHLTMNLGLGGTVNLIWDDYKGFSYNTYTIYRGCTADSLVPFQFLPSTNHSYTDPSPLSCPDLFYMVAAEHPTGCSPTLAKVLVYNSARSNVSNRITTTGISEPSTGIGKNLTDFIVYPNPYTGQTQIAYTLTERANVTLEVLNVLGKKVKTVVDKVQNAGKYQYRFGGSETGSSSGIFVLKLIVNDRVYTKRLVEMK